MDVSAAQKGLSGPGSWTGRTRVPDRAQAEGSGDNEGGFWEETRGQPPPRRMFTHPEPGGWLPLVHTSSPVPGRTHPPRPNHTVKTESLTFFFPPPRLRTGDGLCLQLAQVLGAGAGAGRAARGGVFSKVQVPGSPAESGVETRRVKHPRKSTLVPRIGFPVDRGRGLSRTAEIAEISAPGAG